MGKDKHVTVIWVNVGQPIRKINTIDNADGRRLLGDIHYIHIFVCFFYILRSKNMFLFSYFRCCCFLFLSCSHGDLLCAASSQISFNEYVIVGGLSKASSFRWHWWFSRTCVWLELHISSSFSFFHLLLFSFALTTSNDV